MCILEACVKITNFFPVDQEIHATTDISSKRLVCRFLIASALAALVRRPSVSEAEDQILKDCQSMRGHIRAFHTELKKQDNPSRSSQNPGMQSKLSVLIIFDFEGAIHLGDWDELEDICEAAASCHGSDTLRVLGDSLLRSQALVPSASKFYRDPRTYTPLHRLIIDTFCYRVCIDHALHCQQVTAVREYRQRKAHQILPMPVSSSALPEQRCRLPGAGRGQRNDRERKKLRGKAVGGLHVTAKH